MLTLSDYDERALMLQPGEVIVLYTDGVTEVFDDKDEQFGLERLEELVKDNRDKSAEEIQRVIHEAVIDLASYHNLHDEFKTFVITRL